MAFANVALTDTFDTWRLRTNQLILSQSYMTEGFYYTNGTITIANSSVATSLNVASGNIRVKGNTFDSNAITFVSNSNALVVSGSGKLGTTVYLQTGGLSTTVSDANTANIASANTVNTVNQFVVTTYNFANTAYLKANSANVLAFGTGIGANAWANAVGTAGNNYTNTVGASANIASDTKDTAGNNYTNAVGVAGNNYTVAVGAAGNTYATSMDTAGNNYTITVGASANNWANTKLANTTGTFAGSLHVTANLTVGANNIISVPAGPTSTRPGTGVSGMIRYNTTINKFEGYSTTWGTIGGGATGGGGNEIFFENDRTITTDYTITTNKNAMTAGPISINSGVTVTVPTGSTWTVV